MLDRKKILALLDAPSDDLFSLLKSAIQKASTADDLAFFGRVLTKAKQQKTTLLPTHQTAHLLWVGDFTLFHLAAMTETFAWASGLGVQNQISDFGSTIQFLKSPGPSTEHPNPTHVVLAPSPDHFLAVCDLTLSPGEAQKRVEEWVASYLIDVKSYQRATGANMILLGFLPPLSPELGALRNTLPSSPWNLTRLANTRLASAATSRIHYCDIEYLAMTSGMEVSDYKAYLESKQPFSLNFQHHVARNLVPLIQERQRTPKKVLVTDLDNTLWGGIVGEDGPLGILIGTGDPVSEAFRDFQQYLKRLSQRGVLLAAASKNDEKNVLEAFEVNKEMVLKKEDFISIQANWGPKAHSLRSLSETLKLGLDSFVFIDDDPGEIEMMRTFLPEVEALLLSEDVAKRLPELQSQTYFWPKELTHEDFQRTEMYRAQADFEKQRTETVDLKGFLEALDMRLRPEPFSPQSLQRVTQLINKTNQFNLTTKRRTSEEVLELSKQGEIVSFYLKDRICDHGLIGLIILVPKSKSVWEIDTWLMSCRVLNRTVEKAIFEYIRKKMIEKGATRLEATYRPTPKNGMVSDLLPSLGFVRVGEDSGAIRYQLDSFALDHIVSYVAAA